MISGEVRAAKKRDSHARAGVEGVKEQNAISICAFANSISGNVLVRVGEPDRLSVRYTGRIECIPTPSLITYQSQAVARLRIQEMQPGKCTGHANHAGFA